MKIDRRVEHNIRSVLALSEMLHYALKNPGEFLNHHSLLKAVKSQGALAKFSDDAKGISESSLNTVKRIAGMSIDGGFDALNRLRIAVKDALAVERTRGNRSNKTDKAGLTRRVKELELENQTLREDLLLLTIAFQKSLAHCNDYALEADNAKVLARCKRDQRVLLDMLSLRKHPLATNVIRLRNE